MKKYRGVIFLLLVIFGIAFAIVKNREQNRINNEKIIIKLLDGARNGTD
ncbi:MAG: hypothetical protein ABFC34_13810 [Methanobacterium sp.]